MWLSRLFCAPPFCVCVCFVQWGGASVEVIQAIQEKTDMAVAAAEAEEKRKAQMAQTIEVRANAERAKRSDLAAACSLARPFNSTAFVPLLFHIGAANPM